MAKLTRTIKDIVCCWPAFFGSLLMLWLFSQSATGARLYGQFWPVVTPLTVTSIEPHRVNGIPGVKISGFATIEREECDYLDIEWSLHGERKSVRATAFFADEAEIREAGSQRWEALLVGIPPHKLQYSTGDVRHDCGMFPVLSPFFRPDSLIIPEEVGAKALCHNGAYSASTGPGTCSAQGGVKEWLE